MRGRGAAAATDDVDEAGLGELADDQSGVLRQLIVFAERVRQAGIRIAGDEGVGELRQLGDIRAHVLAAERTVQPDRQRPRMTPRSERRRGGKEWVST